MRLLDLIRTNDWLSVELILVNLYPDQEEGIKAYKKVFHILRERTPTESDIQIVLQQCFDEETNEESYVDVSGQKPSADNFPVTESLGIEFVPWSEWLGMSIHPVSLKEFSELEIISHCLYEMTFFGFDEEKIQEQISRWEKTIDDFKSRSEDEKRMNTKSIGDLFNELEED